MKLRNSMKKYGPRLAIAAPLALAAGNALAEIPAEATAAVAAMQDDFEGLYGPMFGVLAAICIAMLVWRYFKKLSAKV